MAVDLNQIFAGIGQRASQAVMPWAQFAGSGQQADPFASLGQTGVGGFDPWSAFGASKSGSSDPFASLAGGRSGGGGNDVWQALSMISAAKNKITPTPNSQSWTANATGFDTNSFTPDQQQWYAKAKAVAQAHGVDPEIFARQMFQESKFDPNAQSGAGAKGLAQFTDPTAKQYGITNPFDGDQSLDAGARYMSDLLHQYGGDYQKALIAYNGGGRAVQAWQAGTPYGESQTYVNNILQPTQTMASASQSQAATRPSQFGTSTGLSTAEQYAACGPAAALTLAATQGHSFDLRQATDLASQNGLWDVNTGMHGIGSMVSLLGKMGVSTSTVGPDFNQINSQLQAGKPVIFDTPGHYFYVDGVNSQGAYHVGTSGTDLRGGSEWMTPDQIAAVGASHGPVRGAVVLS